MQWSECGDQEVDLSTQSNSVIRRHRILPPWEVETKLCRLHHPRPMLLTCFLRTRVTILIKIITLVIRVITAKLAEKTCITEFRRHYRSNVRQFILGFLSYNLWIYCDFGFGLWSLRYIISSILWSLNLIILFWPIFLDSIKMIWLWISNSGHLNLQSTCGTSLIFFFFFFWSLN